MFYIICLLVGMAIGSGAAWAALAGKIKWLTAEQQRLLALEPELNRLRAENAALQVDKTRLEQEKVS